jgi:hypothetical protein
MSSAGQMWRIGWTRLSRQSSRSRRRSAGQCWRRPWPGCIWSARAAAVARVRPGAAITRQGILWPGGNSPGRGVVPASMPDQQPQLSQPPVRTSITGELIAAQLPQVLAVHDPSHDSQVRPQLPRGDQDRAAGADAGGAACSRAGSGRERAHKASTGSGTDESANGNASEP